jgi:membrane protein implicated in regulation of membrane protease activity
MILVAGALWKAVADEPIDAGTRVVVIESDGMFVKVKKKSQGGAL